MRLLATILLLMPFSIKAQMFISQLPLNPTQFYPKDLWDITVINNSDAKNVYLRGVLNDKQGRQIFEITSSLLVIESGSKKINKNDVNVENLRFNTSNPLTGIIKDFNNLPYGDYSLCVYIYEFETGDIMGENCMDHTSQPVTPPILITPDYCQEVYTKYPLFSWLAPSPQIRGQQVYYDFKLTEVYDGQTNEDAIQRNLAIVFANNLTNTTFLYPSTAVPLDSNKKYAWQVVAKIKKYQSIESPENSSSFENIGVSDVWCLNYKQPQQPEIITEKTNVTYALPKLFEDAAINVYNILYLAYREDYTAGDMQYTIYDSKARPVDVNIPLKLKKGENRFDVNLKQTEQFIHNNMYKMVIQGSNNETYYLNFKYIEK